MNTIQIINQAICAAMDARDQAETSDAKTELTKAIEWLEMARSSEFLSEIDGHIERPEVIAIQKA